ncbi:hypothetical protein [Nocardia mangyaensis]|uniref:hypothetical protein n=1 Tax=Nocardia mangyaensis TaxID=2213200 RepID=UPI0026767106|nr:hypothetical protein [Nocardia mangyaensis]MDO3649330.1 hypothetical protein [Nocardia mangyaensis]
MTYLSDFPVDTELTAERAKETTISHLEAMIGGFTGEASLRRYMATADTLTSCLMDKSADEPPQKFMVSYSVDGTSGRAGLHEFMEAWRKMGWEVGYKAGRKMVDVETKVVGGITPDRYSLNLQMFNDEKLVVTAVSPCFPFDRDAHAKTIPPTIP